jgi:histidine triad (HIT) family protein
MILEGDVPGKFVSETYRHFAIHDVNPRADTHVLVIPVKEYKTLLDMESRARAELLVEAFRIATQILQLPSFYIEINVNKPYQEVLHVHVHVLSTDVAYRNDRTKENKHVVMGSSDSSLLALSVDDVSALIEDTIHTATETLGLSGFRIMALVDPAQKAQFTLSWMAEQPVPHAPTR